MQKTARVGLIVVTILAISTFQVLAGDPPPTNPNGFPSGPHYNLNLIGKKAGFSGCTVETDPITGQPIYGNVVFVPEDCVDGDIWLKSGSGKKATATTLQVTDICVSAFDGDGAEVKLPANNNGYWVYARALAKPTYEPTMTISPELIVVSSEYEDLIYLGLVTPDGFVRPDGYTVTRSKGKSTAIPISDLFDWSGYVCYTQEPSTIGLDPLEYPVTDMCGKDTNGDGIPDEIVGPPQSDSTCPDGYAVYPLYCHHYETPLWVFNIADFVDYLWNIDNNGSKLVQIRFYPR
jgi:hypothetical protein